MRTFVQVMMKNKRWLILLFVLLSLGGYFSLRSPEYRNLSEFPGFFNENNHFVPLKIIKFSSGNIPQIQMQVEDKTIPSKVDLGWDGGVVLPRGILDSLKDKSFIKRKTFFGVRGRSYESDIYELPDIKIGQLRMFSMVTEEQNDEFLKDGSIEKEEQEISERDVGRIGWCVFKPFNLLLDCHHSTMVICDSLSTVKEQGCPIDAFVEAPLLLDRGTIDFEVMTDMGPLRCMLDTGSTWSLLNKNFEDSEQDHRLIDLDHLNGKPLEFNPTNADLLVFNPEDDWGTKTFQINGIEFGPVGFIKMKSPVGFDAIVGMDFIDEHLIFIDFRNQKIYFSKLPEERSLFVRTYDCIQNKVKEICNGSAV